MLNNKGIKDIQSLRDKKSRDATGLFVAEGPKIVAELIEAAPDQLTAVYGLPNWIEAQGDFLKNLPANAIDENVLQRISHLQTPNQVVAVFQKFATYKPDAIKSWCLYLDAIQDPGNLGTIIRLADWFGVPHIVCGKGCADPYNPKVVQSTMASLARVNIWDDAEDNWLEELNAPLLAAALDGTSLYQTKNSGNGVLMIGNESKGLRPRLLGLATQRVTIPRLGKAESLNAAVATGIILSHILGKQ